MALCLLARYFSELNAYFREGLQKGLEVLFVNKEQIRDNLSSRRTIPQSFK